MTGDEVAVDYDALVGAASRVRELMASLPSSPLPRADASAIGHPRLAGALAEFSERWDAVIATAHDEGDLLATRLVDAVQQYSSTDAAAAQAANALASGRGAS